MAINLNKCHISIRELKKTGVHNQKCLGGFSQIPRFCLTID